MPFVDLTQYIVASTGTWTDPSTDQNLFGFTRADTISPERLLLRWAGDFVALTGPLRVRVTVQAENMTVPLALVGNLAPEAGAYFRSGPNGPATIDTAAGFGGLNETAVAQLASPRTLGLQASTIYTYTLDVAAGQAWPFSLSEQLAVLRLQNLRASRFEQLGNNLGFRVIIEPAFLVPDCQPAATSTDLPCDFAVADHGNTARFFPAACEPCEGTVIGLPPAGTVTLVTRAADGGVVRTRFFNGMLITREDLETEQRYLRMKLKLHNRASGAGVVWGLGLGKQGSHLCVLPGYGVDCCGNDLVLTTTYKVEIAALMADPAAARHVYQKKAQRMYLLLEYIECPSDARPVHGDPCATDGSRCEASRIRETVRLRLIAPRDCDAPESMPIKKFLDDVRDLRKRYPVDHGEQPVEILDRAPFQLRITPNRRTPVTVRPSLDTTSVSLPSARLTSLNVEVLPDPGWRFVAGTLSAQALGADGKPVPGVVETPDPIKLASDRTRREDLRATFTLQPGQKAATRQPPPNTPTQLVFTLAAWHAQPTSARPDDSSPAGDLKWTVNLNADGAPENTLAAAVAVKPLDRAASPCADPCAPRQTGRTADFDCGEPGPAVDDLHSVLPWLHADPVHPKAAGDPKALALAALGGWLAEMTTRERAGTANEVNSSRRKAAQAIYQTSWMLLYGVSGRADPQALGRTLRRLLERWCDGLLWKGPKCCGDPHGIIIGCALVDGGTIQSVDPFGGRRYVVHYPLLAHWGAQFGLAPPDITAMRFFSRLCCLASLAPNQPEARPAPAVPITLGAGLLVAGEPRAVAEELQKQQIVIVARRRVGIAEMIVSALALLNTSPSTDAAKQHTALVLADVVEEDSVVLLTPA